MSCEGSVVQERSAYNHALINPYFSLYHGAYFLGMFMSYTSFSFGSARSCIGFQQYTSLIVYITKILLDTKYFPPMPKLDDATNIGANTPFRLGKSCIANYLDDNFTLASTEKYACEVFDTLEAVTKFVGGQMSKKKKLRCLKRGQVLGLLIQCGTKSVAGMRLPSDKTLRLRELFEMLQKHKGLMDFRMLEQLCGLICWLSYYSSFGLLYTLPIVALKWMPKALRIRVFHHQHPLAWELRASINWWIKTLKCDDNMPYIWRVSSDPKRWIRLTSDASGSAWGIHDHRSIYLMSKFADDDKRPISSKELEAVNRYIEFADLRHTGLRLLCDNMQVYWSVKKKAVRPSTDISFKRQVWQFVKNCEKRSLTVLMDWISTHHNYSTDLSSRARPILALATASCIAGNTLELYCDEGISEQADDEMRMILCVLRAHCSCRHCMHAEMPNS